MLDSFHVDLYLKKKVIAKIQFEKGKKSKFFLCFFFVVVFSQSFKFCRSKQYGKHK